MEEINSQYDFFKNIELTEGALRVDVEGVVITGDTIAHPTTVRRDMPSEIDANDLVNASLNGNSAQWVVANVQNTNSNRSDSTIVGIIEGLLDADGNEIPTTPIDGNTIRLRAGTQVRIFSPNDYRVISTPILENDLTNEDDIVDIIQSTLIGGENINLNIDETGNTITINSIGGSEGVSPNRFNRPIRSFTSTVDIDDVPTLEMYDNELALYSAIADNRLEFRLPTDSTVQDAIDNINVDINYPLSLLILHQGGTSRITTGPLFDGPDNTINIVAQGGERLRLADLSPTASDRTAVQVHQNDLATITKEDADSPWLVRVVTLSSGALLLPDGIFNLDPTNTVRFSDDLNNFIITPTSDINTSVGDAYRVAAGDDDFADLVLKKMMC